MQNVKELRLKEYTDFLEQRVDSLEREVQDLQEILTMIFESEEEKTGIETRFSIRFYTCDLDEEGNGDDESDDDEEELDWY